MTFELPTITRQQMIRVDQLMIQTYHISLLQMMEHAGENLARLIQYYARDFSNPRILALCGNGNNGGGGLVAARFLHNWGCSVTVGILGEPQQLKVAPAQHLHNLRKLGIPILDADQARAGLAHSDFEIMLDALVGYGLNGSLRTPLPALIKSMLAHPKIPVIALDAPSGLDVDGLTSVLTVKANATLTLALPKIGLTLPQNQNQVGVLYVADIGVPRELYQELGINPGYLFTESSLVRQVADGRYTAYHFRPESDPAVEKIPLG